MINEVAGVLGVSIAELFAGECMENRNRSSNMRRLSFYVCPVCGNIIQAVGCGSYSCCGILLPELSGEKPDEKHCLKAETVDGEYSVSMEHEMTKGHFISFFAYVTTNQAQLVKLYPEQNAEVRFTHVSTCCLNEE